MTSQIWHADIEISETLVRKCLQNQFPSLIVNEIKFMAEGWDNAVFLVNKKIIFRFPRRKVAVELIERENHVLQEIHSLFDLELPYPKYKGYLTEIYPYPFQGYDLISGEGACYAQLTSEQRNKSIWKIASFLKKLHGFDERRAQTLGAKAQVFDRTEKQKAIDFLEDRIHKIMEQAFCHLNLELCKKELAAAKKIMLPDHPKCLVHGDLYCKHLMFTKGELTGVIDWGDVGINNPAVDLSVIWSFYPHHCHSQFFEIYGEIDSATWEYARFLGLYSSFTLLLYGHETGDIFLVNEAVDSINRINNKLINK